MRPVPSAGRQHQGHPAGGAPAGSAGEQCARAKQRTMLSLRQEASPARRRYTDLGRHDTRRLPQQQIFIVPSVIFSISLGPHVGAHCLCACPPSSIKVEACNVTRQIQAQTHNTLHSGVGLRPGGPNHSKPSCALACSSTNLVTSKTLRPLLILGIRAGAIRHPAGEIYPLTFGASGRGLGLKFLLVPSLSMMVRIIEHRAETSEDLAMEQEVASSVPRVPDRPESGAAVVHVVQRHTPAQVSRTPLRATPMALSAAREFLCHPTSSTASLGAMKQWRDDVDRLLGMAHSTSTRSRPRSSRRQREATASVRSPSVMGAQTDDL
jgi:hypothetical protein